jgi:hypothetical protein
VRAIERLQGTLHHAILAANRDAFIDAIHLYVSTGNWVWNCVFFQIRRMPNVTMHEQRAHAVSLAKPLPPNIPHCMRGFPGKRLAH